METYVIFTLKIVLIEKYKIIRIRPKFTEWHKEAANLGYTQAGHAGRSNNTDIPWRLTSPDRGWTRVRDLAAAAADHGPTTSQSLGALWCGGTNADSCCCGGCWGDTAAGCCHTGGLTHARDSNNKKRKHSLIFYSLGGHSPLTLHLGLPWTISGGPSLTCSRPPQLVPPIPWVRRDTYILTWPNRTLLQGLRSLVLPLSSVQRSEVLQCRGHCRAAHTNKYNLR